VLTDDEQRVEAFLEKPKREDAPPDPRINAGAYVLERNVLDLIPAGQSSSFEHDVFPVLVGDGIYGFDADGYWLDLGTPERYREATRDLLENNLRSYLSEDLSAEGRSISTTADVGECEVEQNVALDHGCVVGAGAKIGRHSVLGRDVVVGAGASVLGSVLMHGVQIGEDARIDGAILGPEVSVGAEATIESDVVIGAGARIAPGANVASGSRIEAAEQVAA
jgi:mannose-1-phosphate guanylyltransferase